MKEFTITLTSTQLNKVLAGLDTRAERYKELSLMPFDPETARIIAHAYKSTAAAIREQVRAQKG